MGKAAKARKAILISHLIGQVRSFVALGAGMTRMKYVRFLGYEVVAATLWNTTFCLLGYLLAAEVDRLQMLIERADWVLLGVLVLLFLAWRFVGRRIRQRIRQERRKVRRLQAPCYSEALSSSRSLHGEFISYHKDLDEDTRVNDTSLPIVLCYLSSQQPGEGFSRRDSSQVKCNIDGMDGMVEHISFGYPDNMQRFPHPLHLDAIVALYRSVRGIRLGHAQPNIPCDYHFWTAVRCCKIIWNVYPAFHTCMRGLSLRAFDIC